MIMAVVLDVVGFVFMCVILFFGVVFGLEAIELRFGLGVSVTVAWVALVSVVGWAILRYYCYYCKLSFISDLGA